jgi:hypothetical protein
VSIGRHISTVFQHPILNPPQNLSRVEDGRATLFLVEIKPGMKAYRYDVDINIVNPDSRDVTPKSLAKGADE